MFGKKILSIVGLLFLGSCVSGTELKTCPASIDTVCDSAIDISAVNKYCLKGTEIYKYEIGSNEGPVECTTKEKITNAGSYVFEDDGSLAKLVTLGSSSDYIVTDKDDLKIYNCNTGGETCTQTYGYASIGDTYYSITKNSITGCNSKSVTVSATGDCSNPEGYCMENGKIYGYTGTDSVCDISTPGVYVFQDAGTNSGATSVTLGTTVISNKDNLMIYRCSKGVNNELSCSRTYGYIYDGDGNKYYAVNADGTVTDVSSEIASNNCNSATMTGKLHDTNKLCLFGKTSSTLVSSAITVAGTYIMNNVGGNVFTNGLGASDGSEDKSIVIQATPNVFSLVSDDYDYCIGDNNVITPTFEEFCDNASDTCTKLAECSSTLCKRDGGNDSSVTPTCSIVIGGTSADCEENGYYLITNTENDTYEPSEDGSGETYLAQCDSATSCHAIIEANMKVGYYKYAGKDNKYIKCTGYHACSVVSVEAKDNCHAATAEGNIINNGNDVLCLSKAAGYTGIPLNANAEYFALGAASGNIFNTDTNKYVKVNVVDSSSVVLSDKLASDTVTYAYTDTNFKSYARASGALQPAAICAASTTIVEFKHTTGDCPSSDCSENTAYYEKHVVYQWPADRT